MGELSREAVKTLTVYFEALAGEPLVPGIIVAIQTFGDRINFHPHLHLLVTEGGLDRAGIFHRLPRPGKTRRVPNVLGLAEEAPPPLTSKGWAEMIRKVYEVDPMICPRCGGKMKVVAFSTEWRGAELCALMSRDETTA